jgi:hypothetical protein
LYFISNIAFDACLVSNILWPTRRPDGIWDWNQWKNSERTLI